MISLVNPFLDSTDSLLVGLHNWWKCDEASGSLLDAHGSLDMTAYNGPTSVTGKANGARSTAGTSQYFRVADAPSMDLSGTDWTVAMWVKLADTSTQTFMCEWGSAGFATASWWLGYNGAFRMAGNSSSNELTIANSSHGAASAGSWYFFQAGVRLGSHLWIRVNGESRDTLAMTSAIRNTSNGWAVAWYNDGLTGQRSTASFDEIALWTRELTDAELDQIRLHEYSYDDL